MVKHCKFVSGGEAQKEATYYRQMITYPRRIAEIAQQILKMLKANNGSIKCFRTMEGNQLLFFIEGKMNLNQPL